MAERNIKKNQHYVWQHYLDPWKSDDQIWSLRHRDDKLFQSNSRNIASQKCFYEAHDLTDDDKKYLDHSMSKLKGERLEVSQGFIDMFGAIFKAKRLVDLSKLEDQVKVGLQDRLSLAAKTAGEEHQTLIENSGFHIVKLLRARDNRFMKDDALFCDFALFIAMQYFRTAKMRNVIYAIYNDRKNDFQKVWPNFHPKRTWPVESLILAANVGFTLLERRSRYQLRFLVNETAVPFITGDQPVINRHSGTDAELSLYYPISPTLGVSYGPVDQSSGADQIRCNRMGVEMLNDQIFIKSDDQIYGNDESVLQPFRQRKKQ